MKIYTQLLKLRIFSIHKAFIQLLISLFFIHGAGDVFAQNKVLNIYFCGTGCKDYWNIPGKPAWHHGNINNPNPTELIATLNYNDDSCPIRKIRKNDIVTAVETWHGATHYKYIVNGIGATYFDEVWKIGQIDPSIGTRNWNELQREAKMAFDTIANMGGNIILNLIGFSRGGVLAIKMASKLADHSQVTKINILAFDPVPGELNTIKKHGESFHLPTKVNQFIGIYARDERSCMFDPLIPALGNLTNSSKVWLTRIPGCHETMVGNCEKDGRGIINVDNTYQPEMLAVNRVATTIAEQLISSKEWGSGTIKTPSYYADTIRNGLLSDISNWNNYNYEFIKNESFTTWEEKIFGKPTQLVSAFSSWDPIYAFKGSDQDKLGQHTMRILWLLPVKHGRFCFIPPYRHNGHPNLLVIPTINNDMVFRLERNVDMMNTGAINTLLSLRGNLPVPTQDPLPTIHGECSATVTSVPTAYDAIAGSITGTTEDPLEYTEQGTYTITWKYDDGNGNVATQEQTVIVEDISPPVIEKLLAHSFTIHPSNYETTEVPQWPVNYRNNQNSSRPSQFSREEIELLKHQRKYETIQVDELVESVSDNCSSLTPEDVIITKVTCDEAKDSRIPVRLRNEDDIIIADDCKSVDLRREFDFRDNGRVYTVHLSLKDEVGNEAIETCQFCVLVSAPAKMAIADAPEYEAHSTCYETDGQPTDMVAGISTKSSISEEKNLDKKEIVPEVGFIKNYPNPFNSYTTFAFGVTEKSDVTLSIYNMKGQLIRVLYSGAMNPGSINVDWDGTDANGNKMASGIYIYRLLANNTVVSSGKTVLKK